MTEIELDIEDESFICEDNEHQFSQQPNASWITTDYWDIKTDIKIKLMKEEYSYNERYECKKCSKYKYVEITEEEFAKKYPEKYAEVMNNYKDNINNMGSKLYG